MLKTAVRWALYFVLFCIAAGVSATSVQGAVAILAIVIGWSAYKILSVITGVRDALDRIGRIAAAGDRGPGTFPG